MIKKLFDNYAGSKVFQNTSWIIAGKCMQMLISFFVGILTARYLGPSNYGVISTATAYTSFFQPLCTLGLSAVFVKMVLDDKDNAGKYLGSGILLRCITSVLSIFVMTAMVILLNPDNHTLQIVCFINSFVLLFQGFDLFDYLYQSRYQSKYSSIIGVIGYAVSAAYKVILLITGKSVEWFAFATVLDYLSIAMIYMLYTVPKNKIRLSFSKIQAKQLLNFGKHFILSNLLVVSYAYLDRIMLSKMIGSTAVGLYTTAVTVCSLWVFILVAIINSMRPSIIESQQTDLKIYEKKIIQLYSIVIWLSIAVSSFICILSPIIIFVLYGKEYTGAVNPLRIITWYTGFSYLGVARCIWTVCENKQHYEKYFALGGVIANFCLNLILIRLLGTEGAALASLITQIITNVVMPYCMVETRKNAIMVIKAFNPKNIFYRNIL